jgi:hypothetical protein
MPTARAVMPCTLAISIISSRKNVESESAKQDQCAGFSLARLR